MHQVFLQNALKAQKAGRLTEATRLIQQVLTDAPNDPHALHIRGFIARDGGDFQSAESHFKASLQDQLNGRTKAEFANNLAKLYLAQGLLDQALEVANFGKKNDPTFAPIARLRAKLLSKVGLHQEAITEALSLTTNSVDPLNWVALTNVYKNALDWPNAEKAARALLAIVPGHKIGRHLLAIAAAQLEPIEQAAAYFAPLEQDSEALVSLANAYLEAGDLERTQETLQKVLRKSPLSLSALTTQAEVLWMTGEAERALKPLQAACDYEPTNQALQVTLAETARKMGALDVALGAIDKALELNPNHPSLLMQRASVFAAQGHLDSACKLAHQVIKAWPDNEHIQRDGAHIFIQAGEYSAALKACEIGRAMRPWSYEWIALMAATKRAMNTKDDQDWFNYDQFVKSMPIDVPDGYDSLDAFNLAVADWLKKRHTFKAHPLINSVRGGTQISLPINQGRDVILDAFQSAIAGPINRYLDNLKTLQDHPFAARMTNGWRLSGLWSVCLRNGGSHVNHIHPGGWISSAYYVELPQTLSNKGEREGWIGFGAPRYPAIGMQHEEWLEPKVGHLALFPSYMWHGVKPFSANAERLTFAFDVVPL